jgi:hypothetical protein
MNARALLLVVCLVLAGCGSATEAGEGSSSPTVTPAPLPPETGTPSPTPALTAGTPVTAETLDGLAAAHAGGLANRSFTATERFVVRDEGGALYEERSRLRAAGTAGTAPYRYDRTSVADPSYPGPQGIEAVALYHADGRTAFRSEDDAGSRYGVAADPLPASPSGDRTGGAFLAELVPAFDTWRVTPADGGRLLRGTDLADPSTLALDTRLIGPRNASVRLRVEPSGRVSRLVLDYDATLNGRTVAVRVERRYGAVGTTSAPEPPWLDRALGTETSTTRVAVTEQVVRP